MRGGIKGITIDIATKRAMPITDREMQVLRLVCEGYSTKQIAEQLGISYKTAAAHRFRLLDKAAVQSSIQLFRWAIKNGLVTLE